jgi:hypothetical protein
MTTDPLDRLRAADPVAHGSSAPPLEWMLQQIAAAPSAPRPRRRLWTSAIVPVFAAVAAIAVVVLSLVLVHAGSTPASRSVPATSATSTVPAVPSTPVGGMRGVVEVYGLAFPSAGHGMISLEQCWPCHAAPHGGKQVNRNWLAITENDGRSWRATAEPWLVSRPQFDGAGDGWAQGVSASRAAGFYVSHDDGRTWATAPSASPSPGLGTTSIAGGEVWAMGEGCQPKCDVTIVHGSASGSRLAAAAAQPVSGDALNLEVVAAAAGVVYVTNPDTPGESFVTHDDGDSWQRFSPPCPRLVAGTGLQVSAPESLWDTCRQAGSSSVLRHSTDGGRHWTTNPMPFGALATIAPVSADIAWGLTANGRVVRTVNGGRSWSTVWTVAGSQPRTLAGHSPMLTAQSVSSATVLVSLTHGHLGKQAKFTNLVLYRTSDRGETWRPDVVRLPAG